MPPETRLIWVETPTNPLLKLVDLAAVAEIAHAARHPDRCATTPSPRPGSSGRSSTASTSWCIRPPSTSTAIPTSSAASPSWRERAASLRERIAYLQNAVGGVPGPFDASWRCAASRRWRCAWSAIAATRSRIARWLEEQPGGRTRVLPRAREPSAARARAAADGGGYGGMVSRGAARRPGRGAPRARALPALLPRREPGRRGEPDRAAGDHDARLDARRRCARTRHR